VAVTVQGATVANPGLIPTVRGDRAGALAVLLGLCPTMTVPKSWHVTSGQQTVGPYTVTHDNNPDGSGVVAVSWQTFTTIPLPVTPGEIAVPGAMDQLVATWPTSGLLTVSPPNTGTVHDPGSVITSPSILDQLGKLLAEITSGAFWRNVGIVAAAVVVAIVGVRILYAHQESRA
jgi:hypothetical protein